MRMGDVNQQNFRDFLALLGLRNKSGSATPQRTAKGSSAADQKAGLFDLAILQRMAANNPTIKSVSIVNGKPHYEIDTSQVKNQYGLTGMEITADTKKEIVPLSDEIKERIIKNERNMFINNYGTSGSDFSVEESIYRDALTPAAEKDRVNISHSIGQMMLAEGGRLINLVKEAIPGWQPGQAFDKDFVRDLLDGKTMDRRA